MSLMVSYFVRCLEYKDKTHNSVHKVVTHINIIETKTDNISKRHIQYGDRSSKEISNNREAQNM